MAVSYLRKYGGVDWCIDTHDHFLYGNAPTTIVDGDVYASRGYIFDCIKQLRPLSFQNKSIILKDVYLRPQKHAATRSFPATPITPTDARTQNLDYLIDVYTTMVVDGRVDRSKLYICSVPHMVGSGVFGPREKDGGYFIVNGMEKIIVNRESRRFDTPLFKSFSDGSYKVEINSLNSPFQISLARKRIWCTLPFLNDKRFSLETFMRAMGYEGPMANLFTNPNPDFFDFVEFPDENITVDEAIYSLGIKFMADLEGAGIDTKRARIKDVFDRILLPFLKPFEKMDFLKVQIQKLVDLCINRQCTLLLDDQLQKETDINSIENKQIDTPGYLFKKELSKTLEKHWYDFEIKLQAAEVEYQELLRSKRKLVDSQVQKLTNPFFIFSHMENKISIHLKTFIRNQKNCMPAPRRANWTETTSVVCRVSASGVHEDSSDDQPRQIHGSYYGFYDMIESQEGEATGRSRDLALFARVTNQGDSQLWLESLLALQGSGPYPCYLNSSIVTDSVSHEAVLALKTSIDRYASVTLEDNRIQVCISSGRLVRPVWVVDKLPEIQTPLAAVDFDEGIARGWIVFLDANEIRLTSVATQRRTIQPFHRYLELAPWSLYGISSCRIPFSPHNYGARNLFGAHVRHQSPGVPFLTIPRHPAASTHNRFDSDQKHWLFYPQRALCTTQPAAVFGDDLAPCGTNLIVALLCDPNNEEDALTFSKGCIERGGCRTWTEVSSTDVETKTVSFGLPTNRIEDWNYDKLDSRGIIEVGQRVLNNDVLVAKYQRRPDGTRHDQTSLRWTRDEIGTVDAVVLTTDGSGHAMVNIRIRWVRVPMVGDKFALRNGQKGVIASVTPDASMPRTWDGMVVDVLMNPFAFVTRRTVGQLFETLAGKSICLVPPEGFMERGTAGTNRDCTPFSESFSLDEVKQLLFGAGMHSRGSERLFSGITGEMMRANVLIGPMYMQRLIHFSKEKSYARGTGPRNPQTLQPLSGRGSKGGIQQGEMDVKAINAHGAAFFLKQQFLNCSDGIEVWVCEQCQDVRSILNDRCRVCNSDLVRRTVTARAFLWFKNLAKAANMDMKVAIEN